LGTQTTVPKPRVRESRVAEKMTTELQTANRELQAEIAERESSDAKFHGLLAAVPDPTVIVDESGLIVHINAQVEKLLGYSREQLVGQAVEVLIPHRFRSKHPGHRRDFLASTHHARPMGENLELHGLRKDGTECPIEISLNPISTQDGCWVVSAIRDVTERRAAQQALWKSEQRFDLAIRATNEGIWDWDIAQDRKYWSPRFYELLGYEPDEFKASGEAFRSLLHPEDWGATFRAVREHLEDQVPYEVEYRLRTKSGQYLWVLARGRAVWDSKGQPLRMVGSIQDITRRKEMEHELNLSRERYGRAAQGSNDGLWDWDLATDTLYLSSRLKSMLGCGENEMGTHPEEWYKRLTRKDADRFQAAVGAHLEGRSAQVEIECRVRKRKGAAQWVLIRGIAVRDADGKARRIAGSQTDISARKADQLQLLHQVHHDVLTDLPNRAFLAQRIEKALAPTRRGKRRRFAVLMLDLDGFKFVNDSLGHVAGDQLLIGVAQRLQACVRGRDTAARLGGDEFAFLLEGIDDLGDARSTAKRIQDSLQSPFNLNGREVFAAASIGITLGATDHQHVDDVLRDADTAMYRAKARGKGRYAVFNSGMRGLAMTRLQLETDLRRAVERDELRLDYQPIVSLESGAICACEALLRWRHAEYGLVSPTKFIPIAEEIGLITSITRWVLREACALNKAWQVAGFPPARVAVNISSFDVKQKDFVEDVRQALSESGLDPCWLELELTEGTMLEHTESTFRSLMKLHNMGIQISIDDFGTGYSSLSQLRYCLFDSLKIDRSFLRDTTPKPDDAAIISSVIALAHNLGRKVVAEGVETLEQLAFLRSQHCDLVQGYLMSAPLPAEETSMLWERGIELLPRLQSPERE